MISLRDHLPGARGSPAAASDIERSLGRTLSIVFLRSRATPSTRLGIGGYSAYMPRMIAPTRLVLVHRG